MNNVRAARTAGLGSCTRLRLVSPCLRRRGVLFGAALGRLRQRSSAAANTESNYNAASPNPSSNLEQFVSGQRLLQLFARLQQSNSTHGTARRSVSAVLLQLWHSLSGALTGIIRLLAFTALFCVAGLLPRPVQSHAAAAGPANTVTASPRAATSSCGGVNHSSGSDDGCSGRSLDGASLAILAAPSGGPAGRGAALRPAAVLLADLAAVPPAAVTFSHGLLAGPSGRGPSAPAAAAGAANSTLPHRGDLYGTGRDSGGAAAVASTSTSAAASLQPLATAPALTSSGPSLSSALQNGAVGGGGGGVGTSSSSSSQVAAAAAAAVDPETAALAAQLGVEAGEAGVIRLFEQHRASVVNISGMRAMQSFTTLDLGKMPYGQGSGFLWGEKGHVVTCYHLVKGASEVKVTLYDNTSYTAKVLGYDAAKNVAVLKLSVPKSKLRELQPVTLGSAADLRVGQNVYGIGNPWGLGHTLSRGLVCGLGLELSAGLFPIKGVILTDCAPDPGSSGGVLLDSKGSLVGMMVTPPASSGGGGGGGGGRSFAVPLDAIRGLVNQILTYGRTVRPALGITMAPAQVLERVGLEGVLVLEVPPGSPSHAAGLRPTHRDIFGDLVLGDVIVGLDGKAVRSSSDVYDILDEHRVGDRVKLDVVRDGKQTGLTVTLGERLLGAVEE